MKAGCSFDDGKYYETEDKVKMLIREEHYLNEGEDAEETDFKEEDNRKGSFWVKLVCLLVMMFSVSNYEMLLLFMNHNGVIMTYEEIIHRPDLLFITNFQKMKYDKQMKEKLANFQTYGDAITIEWVQTFSRIH